MISSLRKKTDKQWYSLNWFALLAVGREPRPRQEKESKGFGVRNVCGRVNLGKWTEWSLVKHYLYIFMSLLHIPAVTQTFLVVWLSFLSFLQSVPPSLEISNNKQIETKSKAEKPHDKLAHEMLNERQKQRQAEEACNILQAWGNFCARFV